MLYLDTSLLIAAVSEENATPRVLKWLRTVEDPVAISDWSIAEFAGALEGKTRGGQMLVDQRDVANRWFRVLIAEIAELLPVDRSAFRRAATIITTAGVRVRAADALHLATAEAYGAKVCTLDKPQAEAAKACAIQTMLFASPP